MADKIVKKGSTNVSVELYIVDSTDGTPELGVLYNTAGIDLNYRRDGAAVTTITEATLAALTTAHTDGGFLEIANGRYRFDVPDAAFASGVSQVTVGGTVTGMVVYPVTVQLVDYDPEDSASLGLTAVASDVVADAVFDELTSGHNVAGSFGKAIRQLKEGVISEESSVFDASASTTSFTTLLSEDTDDHYNDLTMCFTNGTLAGQSRIISDYDGTTKTVSFDEAWTEAPADTDNFIIKTDHVHPISQIQSGLATPTNITAGTITTVSGNVDGSVASVTGAVGSVTSGVTLATSEDIYHADIEYNFDSPNDEYTVRWMKNGSRVVAGITLPKIQVVKRSDGTDLVAATAMTQIGTTGAYKYDESTNTIDADEMYEIVMTATIDASTRTWGRHAKRSS
jgi:hypothetical protein